MNEAGYLLMDEEAINYLGGSYTINEFEKMEEETDELQI